MKADQLELRYVPLDTVVKWNRNPKKHDYGAIISSIKKHGFRDPMAYDSNLNDGKGGIIEGNGRSTALKDLKMNGEKPPRGILVDGEQWLVPVLFGVDAKSQRAAEAYAIDHNSLTMLGGDFGIYEIAKMYESKEYAALLKDLQIENFLPVSMDDSDINAYLNTLNNNGVFDPNNEWQGMPEFNNPAKAVRTIIVHFRLETDVEDFCKLISQTIGTNTKFIWHPKQERRDLTNIAYTIDSDNEN